MPFRRHDASVAVSNLFGLSADTTLSWNQRTPYPDWQPMAPVQLVAPTQAVTIAPESVWNEMVTLHREVLEQTRKEHAKKANKPSKVFLGSSADGREFMMRSQQAEAGLRFHRY